MGFIVFSVPIKPALHWCWVPAWMEGVEGKVKAGGARCAPRAKVPRVMWHKLQLLNLALHCFHTRERMVMLIRLDSLRGGKKKTLTLHTMPSASLNPMREAEVSPRRGGISCTGPAPTGENPPALPRVLWGGEGKSVLPAGIGWKTGGWGQHVDKMIPPALGSALREPDAAACNKTVCNFGRTIWHASPEVGHFTGRL